MFQKASRKTSFLRMGFVGPSGSGKTMTAMRTAAVLAAGKRFAVIDSERGSASKYASDTPDNLTTFAFDVHELTQFSPAHYRGAIREALKAGYKVIIIDSLSQAWAGPGGILEMVDKAKERERNDFAAWRHASPEHSQLVDTMLQAPAHIIATMRAKTHWEMKEISRNGKTMRVPEKVGLAPVQRDGIEFEFDIIVDMNTEHTAIVSKSRCTSLADKVIHVPTTELGSEIVAWLNVDDTPEQRPQSAPQRASEPASGTKSPPDQQAAWWAFLKACKDQKDRLGDHMYYAVLKEFGFEKANLVPKDNQMLQSEIIRILTTRNGEPFRGEPSERYIDFHHELSRQYVERGATEELRTILKQFATNVQGHTDLYALRPEQRDGLEKALVQGLNKYADQEVAA
jgi:hypothetical protein